MMKTFTYKPTGVCSRKITVELTDDNVVHSVQFEGGCSGNTQGVSALIVGMTAEEAIRRLSGIRCGLRPTSCPDQLAHALTEALQTVAV